tara:strand:- start:81 stop:233 length:153 start_codon:yes stop_codon:yes gene_type:complete
MLVQGVFVVGVYSSLSNFVYLYSREAAAHVMSSRAKKKNLIRWDCSFMIL